MIEAAGPHLESAGVFQIAYHDRIETGITHQFWPNFNGIWIVAGNWYRKSGITRLRIICNITAWKNRGQSGSYLTVELSNWRKREDDIEDI